MSRLNDCVSKQLPEIFDSMDPIEVFINVVFISSFNVRVPRTVGYFMAKIFAALATDVLKSLLALVALLTIILFFIFFALVLLSNASLGKLVFLTTAPPLHATILFLVSDA
jgi:hypothetical protein